MICSLAGMTFQTRLEICEVRLFQNFSFGTAALDLIEKAHF
jgi:hypothetical protein